jgi:hypothetical protein
MNEKTPDQAAAGALALDQLRLLGDLLSCLDAAGYDPGDTQQLQLLLAAHLRPQPGRHVPGPDEGDQVLRPELDKALVDSLDVAALIARSSLGTRSARRIRSQTSTAQIAEILRRRDPAAATGQPPACPAETRLTKSAPASALLAQHQRPTAGARPRQRPRWRFRMPSAPSLRVSIPTTIVAISALMFIPTRRWLRAHMAWTRWAAVGAALVVIGITFGSALSSSGSQTSAPAVSPVAPKTVCGSPGQAGDGPGACMVRQSLGAADAVWVVRASGFEPGKAVTVALSFKSAPQVTPAQKFTRTVHVTPSAGTFQLNINQLFPGTLRLGLFGVEVTGPGGREATTSFIVIPPGGP